MARPRSPLGTKTPSNVARPGQGAVQGAGKSPVPAESLGMVMTGGRDASLVVRKEAMDSATAPAIQATDTVTACSLDRIPQSLPETAIAHTNRNPRLNGGTGCMRRKRKKTTSVGLWWPLGLEKTLGHCKAFWSDIATRSKALQNGIHSLRYTRLRTANDRANFSHGQ
jgi:hypothetical protein